MRKTVFAVALLALLALQAAGAWAQAVYPARPVRVIIPFPPGGTNDQVMRTIGDKFAQSTGQPFVIDNRGGGSGIIGTEAVARGEPDGYTIGYVSMHNLVINVHLFKSLPYDPIRSFDPITRVAASTGVFAVHAAQPVQSLKEFIAWVKAHPGKMTVASNGATDPTNVIILLMNKSIGLDLQPVYYKGGALAVQDFLGGHVPAIVNVLLGLKPLGASGKAKLLAVSKAKRSALLPDVPTFAELGYPDIVVEFGGALVAPGGTPKAIIDKLHAEVSRVLVMPDVVQRLNILGVEPLGGTPAEVRQIIHSETKRWGALVKVLGWKAE